MTKKRLSPRWAAMKEFHLLRLVARVGNNPTKKLYLRRQRIIAKAQLQETTMTYSPSDGVARRVSHGDDVDAGYSPWPHGPGRVLSESPGIHVVHFRLV